MTYEKEKDMTKKEGFKTVETDLEELEEKIHDHRKKIFKRILITIIAVLAVFAAAQLWMALRSYDSYDIKNSVDQGDKSAVQFGTFCGNVIEYSNDGAVYMYGNGELIWNQAFEMASPHIEKCETYMAIYDKNGTDLFIMNKEGVVKEIDTSLPISTVCIARQGTIAVLLNDGENYYVKLYDTAGKELASGEFYGEEGSIPVDIALSFDAKKLAVDMMSINAGKVSTIVSFYNFGSVGQNEIDNNVGTYTYEDVLVPEIAYVSDKKMIAIGDSEIIIFDGKEKPAEKTKVELDKEADNVFYSDDYVGIAYKNNDEKCTSHIIVYDMNGKMVMENDTAINYSKIEMNANNEVCVTSDYECEIYTVHGVKKFSYTFDTQLYAMLYEDGLNNYIIIHEGTMDEVRLK